MERKLSGFILLLVILTLYLDQCRCGDIKEASRLNAFASEINSYLFLSDEKSTPSTLIWSPLSVYASLLPLLNAAGGSTQKELERVLQFSQPVENGNASKKSVRYYSSTKEHSKASTTSSEESASQSGFKSATGLFISNEYELNEQFSKSLKSTSGVFGIVEVESLDLRHESPIKLSEEINEWVNSSTGGLIREIIQPDAFNSETKLILVNAVEFKAKWRFTFEPSDTEIDLFHGSKGYSQVPFMFQRSTQDFGQFETKSKETFEVLKLGYSNNDMKIIFIMPNDPLTLPDIIKEFISSEVQLGDVIQQLEPTELDIYLPKFKLESRVPIKAALLKGGVKSIFSPMDANLTQMINFKTNSNNISKMPTSSSPLYLSDLIHKTVFEVDESGTKAGAATAGFFLPLSGIANHRIRNFTLNKPFILLLRDAHSSINFHGVINDLPGLSQDLSLTELNEPPSKNPDASKSHTPSPMEDSENLYSENPQGSLSENQIASPKSHQENPSKLTSDSIENENAENTDPNAWWVHKGTPEYLTSSPNSNIETTVKTKVESFPRFQQPEPSSPDGIRFPYTGPFKPSASGGILKQDVKHGGSGHNEPISNHVFPGHRFHGEVIRMLAY